MFPEIIPAAPQTRARNGLRRRITHACSMKKPLSLPEGNLLERKHIKTPREGQFLRRIWCEAAPFLEIR